MHVKNFLAPLLATFQRCTDGLSRDVVGSKPDWGHGTSAKCAAVRIVESARAIHGTLDLGDIDEIAVWAEAQGLEFVEGDPLPQGRTDFFRCYAGHLWEVSRRSPVGAWCPACGTRGAAMGVGRVAP